MEPLSAFAAGLKSLWVSMGFLVAVVIWVYKLRLDTNKNTEDLKSYKKYTNSHITELKDDFQNRMHDMKSDIYTEIKSMKTELTDELKEHSASEVARAIRVYEKLEEIQRDVVDIKIYNAKNSKRD
tara:strand:- start:245 stop:622 length:378 start_codon:yes stop_codon:yes gene_type:complete